MLKFGEYHLMIHLCHAHVNHWSCSKLTNWNRWCVKSSPPPDYRKHLSFAEVLSWFSRSCMAPIVTYLRMTCHHLGGRACPFSENAFRRSTFGVRYWNGCLRGRTATVINLSVKVWDLRTWENINRHKYSNIMCHNTVLIWIWFDFPILHCYWIAWGVRSWKIWKLNWTETECVKSIWRVNIYSNEQSSRARKNCNSPSVRTDPVHVCNENASVQKVSIVHALPWSHMCTMSHSHISATVKVTATEKNQMLSFTCYSTWNLAYTGVGENKLVSSSAASD